MTQVFFIQYSESLGVYASNMAQAEITRSRRDDTDTNPREKSTPAAGLFGYSICDSEIRSFKPTEGYLRDMEQMPNFSPPSINSFVAHYLASNIGRTSSSS